MRTNILGVGVDNVSLGRARKTVLGYIRGDRPRVVFTPNPEMIMAARRDPELLNILGGADLVVPDGVGVVLASKLTDHPINARTAGFDLIRAVLGGIAGKNSVYLLGGKPGVAVSAAKRLRKAYPGLEVVGAADGYFDLKKEKQILEDIRQKRPDLLLVGLGMGKQEKWINRHKGRLPFKAAIGCGGSLDVFAGNAKRAPAVFRALGLEWFYRLVREPSRLRRQLCLPAFAALAVSEWIRRKYENIKKTSGLRADHARGGAVRVRR